jgi:hypothetical protein
MQQDATHSQQLTWMQQDATHSQQLTWMQLTHNNSPGCNKTILIAWLLGK